MYDPNSDEIVIDELSLIQIASLARQEILLERARDVAMHVQLYRRRLIRELSTLDRFLMSPQWDLGEIGLYVTMMCIWALSAISFSFGSGFWWTTGIMGAIGLFFVAARGKAKMYHEQYVSDAADTRKLEPETKVEILHDLMEVLTAQIEKTSVERDQAITRVEHSRLIIRETDVTIVEVQATIDRA